MNVYIDIETIPSQSPAVREELWEAVKAPATYKKPESVAQWLEENREAEAEAAWLKTSFDGGLGQIVAVCYCASETGDPVALRVQDLSLESEAAMLEVLFDDLQKLHSTHGTRPVIVGHNVAAFDLPFLWKRAIVHGVKPPMWLPRNPKPWNEYVFDTMHQWDSEKRVSMDKLCRILGIEGKGDITGADVWPLVQAGKLAEVAEYCRDDVRRTRSIYQRMTFAGLAK